MDLVAVKLIEAVLWPALPLYDPCPTDTHRCCHQYAAAFHDSGVTCIAVKAGTCSIRSLELLDVAIAGREGIFAFIQIVSASCFTASPTSAAMDGQWYPMSEARSQFKALEALQH